MGKRYFSSFSIFSASLNSSLDIIQQNLRWVSLYTMTNIRFRYPRPLCSKCTRILRIQCSWDIHKCHIDLDLHVFHLYLQSYAFTCFYTEEGTLKSWRNVVFRTAQPAAQPPAQPASRTAS